jgi:hypothetical protein
MDHSVDKKSLHIQKLKHIFVDQIASISSEYAPGASPGIMPSRHRLPSRQYIRGRLE